MPDRTRLSAEDVRAAACIAGLDLTPEREATLQRTLSEFVDAFTGVWALDVGDRQPATLGFDDEGEDGRR